MVFYFYNSSKKRCDDLFLVIYLKKSLGCPLISWMPSIITFISLIFSAFLSIYLHLLKRKLGRWMPPLHPLCTPLLQSLRLMQSNAFLLCPMQQAKYNKWIIIWMTLEVTFWILINSSLLFDSVLLPAWEWPGMKSKLIWNWNECYQV